MIFTVMLLNALLIQNVEPQILVADLGEIQIFAPEDANRVLSGNFVFTNKSLEALRVASIKKSCGCASVEIKSDQDVVNPGQSIGFLMRIDLSKKSITHDYVLDEKGTVTFKNTSGDYILPLKVTANIKMRGLPRLIDIGKLKDENFAVRRYFNIRPPAKRKFKMISISCEDPAVNVSYEKKLLARYYRIHFEFEMENMKLGRNSFKLTMKYILDGTERNQTALVQFEKIPKVQYPKSISMGVVRADTKSISKTFKLLPGYEGITFGIKSVEATPSESISCTWNTMEGNNGILFNVDFQSPPHGDYGRAFHGNIKVEFLDGIKPVNIPVFALFLRGTN